MTNPIRRLKDIVIKVLDSLLIFYFILLLVPLLGRGFEFPLFGMKVKAHSLKNPLITFVLLLLLRKILSIKENFNNLLLVKIITFLIRRITKLLDASPSFCLGLFIGGYALILSIVTVLRHISYHTQAFDLGIFDQVLWNITHGNGLYSSILGHHFFGEHVSPILVLIAPLYWIYADPKILLIFQSCALASGALPVYWLARKKLESTRLALLFSFVYLCYLPLRNLNLTDFHPIALATPLLLFAFFYLDQRKYLTFGLFLTLALLCKEEISLVVFIFGVYIAFIRKNRKLGVVLSLLGVAVFALDIWVIIPHYRESSFGFVHRYSYLGQSIPEILSTLLFRPVYVARHIFISEKMDFFLSVFGPVGFLSFFSPSHLLLALPTFSQNVLSDFPPQYSIYFQYTAPLTPFVFVSAICGLQNLLAKTDAQSLLKLNITKNHIVQVISGMLLVITCFSFSEKLPIYPLTERTQLTNEFIRLIPSSVPVSAQELYVPHLSHRKDIYLFPDIEDAEYIFLDMTSRYRGPISEIGYFEKIATLFDRKYGVLACENNLVIFKKGYDRTKNSTIPRIQKKERGYVIDGALLPSKIGKVKGTARKVKEGREHEGFVTHGPYFEFPKGKYMFSMVYSTENLQAGEKIGKWDIGFASENTLELVKNGSIISVEGNEGIIVQEVVISDRYEYSPIEFRSYYLGKGNLAIKNITIERAE